MAEVMGVCSNDLKPSFFLKLKNNLKNPATKTSSLIPWPQIVTAGNSIYRTKGIMVTWYHGNMVAWTHGLTGT